jgi:hypothetical protein
MRAPPLLLTLWGYPTDMARKTAAVALAAFLSCAPAAAPVDGKTKPHCRPHRSQTVAQSKAVRVYVLQHLVWACDRHSGERYELGVRAPRDLDQPSDVRVRLQGRIVGWVSTSSDRYGNEDYVVKSRDVPTGLTLHEYGNGGSVMQDPGIGWTVHSFVMDRKGSIAWIATAQDVNGPVNQLVMKEDVSFDAETLDSGPDIGSRSLRRDGRTITWRHGDDQRSAELEK